jgi:hypothetical protein
MAGTNRVGRVYLYGELCDQCADGVRYGLYRYLYVDDDDKLSEWHHYHDKYLYIDLYLRWLYPDGDKKLHRAMVWYTNPHTSLYLCQR